MLCIAGSALPKLCCLEKITDTMLSFSGDCPVYFMEPNEGVTGSLNVPGAGDVENSRPPASARQFSNNYFRLLFST